MKVSGITFVKNAVKYGYPVVASIQSILPVVDEMVICLGDSDDETEALITSIKSDKIKIVHSVWDKSLREGGKVLAVETNKAMDAASADSDWLFYIQADEVVHEKYHAVIADAMKQYQTDPKVEGLLFNYHHFYGSYRFIGDGRKWYSKEIRVIKNNRAIRSFKDAQGFRMRNGSKLHVKQVDANIFHYGWVKHPMKMTEKVKGFHKMWHSDDCIENQESLNNDWDYNLVERVEKYTNQHPKVMLDRIQLKNWKFDFDPRKVKVSLKNKIIYFIEKHLGYSIAEYKNYILLR